MLSLRGDWQPDSSPDAARPARLGVEGDRKDHVGLATLGTLASFAQLCASWRAGCRLFLVLVEVENWSSDADGERKMRKDGRNSETQKGPDGLYWGFIWGKNHPDVEKLIQEGIHSWLPVETIASAQFLPLNSKAKETARFNLVSL